MSGPIILLAVTVVCLIIFGIIIHSTYRRDRREELEAPAQRMLDDE